VSVVNGEPFHGGDMPASGGRDGDHLAGRDVEGHAAVGGQAFWALWLALVVAESAVLALAAVAGSGPGSDVAPCCRDVRPGTPGPSRLPGGTGTADR
jgi:hypothetical protein